MADTPKRFYGPAQPSTSGTTCFTVGASKIDTITCITVVNTTATGAWITLSIGADSAATRILDQVEVPARETLVLNGLWVLAATEDLRADQGTASALTLTVSGVESDA